MDEYTNYLERGAYLDGLEKGRTEAQAEIAELVEALERVIRDGGYRSPDDDALVAKHKGE